MKAFDQDRPGTIPDSFLGYLKSMGPGIVVVLTWLGAGDIVGSAVAGGHYGYSLMWALPLCLLLRYLFVSIVSKYQLCNPRSESVVAGLSRLHPFFALAVLLSAALVGHGVGVVLLIGAGEAMTKLTGIGSLKLWATGWTLFALLLVFKPRFRRIELAFFVFAGVLTVSFLSLAVWVQPSALGIVKGIFGLAVPERFGQFDASFLLASLIGAVGGGLGNLIYPYFIKEKGWTGPQHRRVQRYDLMFGIVVLIVLDLSIWVVGAEVLHVRGLQVTSLDSLSLLLGEVMGLWGTQLFYLGVLAALVSSVLGNGTAYGLLIADSYIQIRQGAIEACGGDYKKHAAYRWAILWIVLSPLGWVFLGQADFVGLSVTVNAAQVLVIPLLVAGLWLITARKAYIGSIYRNRWWENVLMGLLLIIAATGALLAARGLLSK